MYITINYHYCFTFKLLSSCAVLVVVHSHVHLFYCLFPLPDNCVLLLRDKMNWQLSKIVCCREIPGLLDYHWLHLVAVGSQKNSLVGLGIMYNYGMQDYCSSLHLMRINISQTLQKQDLKKLMWNSAQNNKILLVRLIPSRVSELNCILLLWAAVQSFLLATLDFHSSR